MGFGAQGALPIATAKGLSVFGSHRFKLPKTCVTFLMAGWLAAPFLRPTDSSLKNGVLFREHRLFALESVAQKVWYTATLSIEMSSTVSAAGTSGGGNGAISARQLLGAGLRPAKSQFAPPPASRNNGVVQTEQLRCCMLAPSPQYQFPLL